MQFNKNQFFPAKKRIYPLLKQDNCFGVFSWKKKDVRKQHYSLKSRMILIVLPLYALLLGTPTPITLSAVSRAKTMTALNLVVSSLYHAQSSLSSSCKNMKKISISGVRQGGSINSLLWLLHHITSVEEFLIKSLLFKHLILPQKKLITNKVQWLL